MRSPWRCVRFTPSKVHGLPNVTDVAVFPDRLEIVTAGRRVTLGFQDFARTTESRLVRRVRQLLGLAVSTPAVAFHWKGVFEFHTTPVIKIYPPEQAYDNYVGSVEWQVKEVITAGGYITDEYI